MKGPWQGGVHLAGRPSLILSWQGGTLSIWLLFPLQARAWNVALRCDSLVFYKSYCGFTRHLFVQKPHRTMKSFIFHPSFPLFRHQIFLLHKEEDELCGPAISFKTMIIPPPHTSVQLPCCLPCIFTVLTWIWDLVETLPRNSYSIYTLYTQAKKTSKTKNVYMNKMKKDPTSHFVSFRSVGRCRRVVRPGHSRL